MKFFPRAAALAAALALALAVEMPGVPVSVAQADDRLADDIPLPLDDPEAIENGKARYGDRCAFCHGSAGRGGKGPSLTNGKFKRGGKASNLYANIAVGVPGTQMGAFGTTLSQEEILNIIAYLRTEMYKRIESGEIPDPRIPEEAPAFPPQRF
jgi:mono/diheme cytochrome c family protein